MLDFQYNPFLKTSCIIHVLNPWNPFLLINTDINYIYFLYTLILSVVCTNILTIFSFGYKKINYERDVLVSIFEEKKIISKIVLLILSFLWFNRTQELSWPKKRFRSCWVNWTVMETARSTSGQQLPATGNKTHKSLHIYIL